MSSGDGLPVIACELQALSPAERARRAALADAVKVATVQVVELASGYAIHLAGAAVAAQAHELLALERQCCPFLKFELGTEPASGRTIVTITGGSGVKEFIAAQFFAKEGP